MIAQTALYFIQQETSSKDGDDQWLASFRINSKLTRSFKFFVNAEKTDFVLCNITNLQESGSYRIEIIQSDGKSIVIPKNVLHRSTDTAQLTATVGEARGSARIVQHKDAIHVFSGGYKYELFTELPLFASVKSEGSDGSVVTPMPCKISQVNVKPGDSVKKGQTLVILEAMKMEHVMKSPQDGVIESVNYEVGDMVGEGKRLISFRKTD